MTIHRREGEGGRGVNSAGMKKMKTGRYTILNYKVDELGKGGKIRGGIVFWPNLTLNKGFHVYRNCTFTDIAKYKFVNS